MGDSRQRSNMVTSFGFQATAVCPPFVSGPGAGEGVVFIHKLSGHVKCVLSDSCQRPRQIPNQHKTHLKIISDCFL